jgi:hypothetical protein
MPLRKGSTDLLYIVKFAKNISNPSIESGCSSSAHICLLSALVILGGVCMESWPDSAFPSPAALWQPLAASCAVAAASGSLLITCSVVGRSGDALHPRVLYPTGGERALLGAGLCARQDYCGLRTTSELSGKGLPCAIGAPRKQGALHWLQYFSLISQKNDEKKPSVLLFMVYN